MYVPLATLLPVIKPIWFTAFQPCGRRLHALLTEGLPAYETDPRRLDADLRALENRGQQCTLTQIRDLEASLPFRLLGVASDNGGEFINHHLVAYLGQRQRPVRLTRARAYQKNDNAHVEQRNGTHGREHFGHERYDNPAMVPRINTRCKGPLGQLLNHFLPTQQWREKRRVAQRQRTA